MADVDRSANKPPSQCESPVSPKTAYLKQTSEQRCREAFEKWCGIAPPAPRPYLGGFEQFMAEPLDIAWNAWQACWKYLEERLLKEIQS